MLPVMKNTVLAAMAALSVAAIASPALAFGDKEQGFVAGAATAIIVDQLMEGNRARRGGPPPAYYAPAPSYRPAPPAYYDEPRYAPRPTYYEPRQPRYTSSVYATPAAKAFQSYSSGERRAIQRRLASAGYYYGGIDGSFGPGTYNAVTAYARDRGNSNDLRSTNGAFSVYDGLLF